MHKKTELNQDIMLSQKLPKRRRNEVILMTDKPETQRKIKELALQQLTINLGLLTQVQFQSFLNFHTTWMTAVTVTPTILYFIHGVNALITHWIER